MKAIDAGHAVATRLRAAGIPDAGFEGEFLARSAGGLDRTQYFVGAELGIQELARLDTFESRRLRREPSAYITEGREFYGLPFRVSQHVLIPRPETELLVEVALEEIEVSGTAGALSVVDVGTGSGCVAVAVAKSATGKAAVTGVDASSEALRVARCNAGSNETTIRFVLGDLAGSITDADIVLANLPYIPAADIQTLDPEVGQWEPRNALDGGPDGLELIRRLVDDCGARIRPCLLALEVGFGRASEVSRLAQSAGASTEVRNDLAGIQRVVCARW
jgi:release factor glutamine methyltransferase